MQLTLEQFGGCGTNFPFNKKITCNFIVTFHFCNFTFSDLTNLGSCSTIVFIIEKK